VTVVVGIRGRKGVLLAGDSQASTPWSNRKVADSKTFAISELVAIAYCGSARLGNLLTYHTDGLDDPPLGRDEHRWAVRDFIPFVRWVAEEHGYLEIHHNAETLGDAAFLLAVRGRLFTVDTDMQVAEHRLPYDALGSGDDVAIGAMHSQLGDQDGPVEDRRLERVASHAIAAASEFTNFVGGDLTTVRTALWTDEERQLARRIVGR
jgi:ATP-dependent protease HslVU (ClpYQ) peptidase subunit